MCRFVCVIYKTIKLSFILLLDDFKLFMFFLEWYGGKKNAVVRDESKNERECEMQI